MLKNLFKPRQPVQFITKADLDKLNSYPIDLCFKGAISNPRKHWSAKDKMFIWIFIQYLRFLQDSKKVEFIIKDNQLLFQLQSGSLIDWDNEAINSLKFKKRKLYDCLIPLLEEHFMNVLRLDKVWKFKAMINKNLNTVQVLCF